MEAKLKSLIRSEQTYFAVLLCVIAVTAYGLGRQSVAQHQPVQSATKHTAGIIFTEVISDVVETNVLQVVASKNGTKYHAFNCPGAATIKDANKLYFNSIDQAKAAGYAPAANCEF